jgi:hypothetical protein
VGEALRALTTFDGRWACDVLHPVYDTTGNVDGRVSIEVDPRLAHDTQATIAEARALWWTVDRPNLFIKIPAARQGLAAIAECLAEGISINSHVGADAVIVGVGVTPATQLATAAGLEVDNGIKVDAQLRSSAPATPAVGDVANAFHPLLGKHIRVEHWANALHQPQTAARAMLGQDVAYDRVPYFYTDQYELSMEYSGYVEPDGYDQVVFRGDVDKLELIAFWLAGGRVLAGMNVNVWDVTDSIQALVRSGKPVDTARLTDPRVPLKLLLDG